MRMGAPSRVGVPAAGGGAAPGSAPGAAIEYFCTIPALSPLFPKPTRGGEGPPVSPGRPSPGDTAMSPRCHRQGTAQEGTWAEGEAEPAPVTPRGRSRCPGARPGPIPAQGGSGNSPGRVWGRGSPAQVRVSHQFTGDGSDWESWELLV